MFSFFGRKQKNPPPPEPLVPQEAATAVATADPETRPRDAGWGLDASPAEPSPSDWTATAAGAPPDAAGSGAPGLAAGAGIGAEAGIGTGTEAGVGLNLDALLAPPAGASGSQPAIGPTDEALTEELKPRVVDAISTVFDPEIPVNIYELGLIYEIAADAESRVGVKMTLTSPACPSAQQLPSEVRYKVKALEGVTDCAVEIVWEPPWTKDMMSETAKMSLGIF